MISIQKYLRGRNEIAIEDPESGAGVLLGICRSLFECINSHVLTGDSAAPLRLEVAGLMETLGLDVDPVQAAQIGETTRRILGTYGAAYGPAGGAARLSADQSADEMQQIVKALSQALSLVGSGGERSVSLLQRIQETLQRTALIQDVTALRVSLSKAIDVIKEEVAGEKRARARDLTTLQAEVNKVRILAAGKSKRKLLGRPEGIRRIADALRDVKPDEALFVVAFLFDDVKSIIQRFGPDVADELIGRIIHERIQPVAPENAAYRWTPCSLVGIFQSAPDLAGLKSRMAELNRGPLVHNVELGNRTAVLKLGLSHLIAQGAAGAQDQLIDKVDRFTGAAA